MHQSRYRRAEWLVHGNTDLWSKQVRDSATPHKMIFRVVLFSLQRSGCQTQASLVKHLKEKNVFPERAEFTAWIIPYGFRHHHVGTVVVPVTSLNTRQMSLMFAKTDRQTMSIYSEQIRVSLDKEQCSPYWVHTAEADMHDNIVRQNIDDRYDVHQDFYTASS